MQKPFIKLKPGSAIAPIQMLFPEGIPVTREFAVPNNKDNPEAYLFEVDKERLDEGQMEAFIHLYSEASGDTFTVEDKFLIQDTNVDQIVMGKYQRRPKQDDFEKIYELHNVMLKLSEAPPLQLQLDMPTAFMVVANLQLAYSADFNAAKEKGRMVADRIVEAIRVYSPKAADYLESGWDKSTHIQIEKVESAPFWWCENCRYEFEQPLNDEHGVCCPECRSPRINEHEEAFNESN